jgi:Na+/melibiose symporter-like transporter
MLNTNLMEKKIKVKGDDLKRKNIVSYGIGHFLNDLCASCWFFFLSYYLTDILALDKDNAGYIMLAGQVADAIATPLVGIFSDKTETRWGKRTPWYFGGTLMVAVSFMLIFVNVLPSTASPTITLIYYLVFPSLFNIGWAAVQVAHMALLPSLSLNKKIKDKMIRIRTAFTFIAQTGVLLLSFFFFWFIPNKLLQYEVLAGSCVVLGLITSVVFLIYCKEHVLSKNIPSYFQYMKKSLKMYDNQPTEDKRLANDYSTADKKPEICNLNLNGSGESECSKKEIIPWTFWLTKPDFYAYILVYMFVRLSINVTQSVIPYYLQFILRFDKTEDGGTPFEFSIILLISTVGSIINSLLIQAVIEKKIKNANRNRLILMSLAAFFVSIGCVPMFFLDENFKYPIYLLAFFFGIGFSQGLSTVGSLINDVVGSKGAQGAFVYGAYSFSDKLSCGIVLLFFIPIASEVKHKEYLRYFMPFFGPIAISIGLIIVYFRGVCIERNEEKLIYDTLSDEKDINDVNKEIEKQNEKAKVAPVETSKKSFIDDSRFTFVTHLTHRNTHVNQTLNPKASILKNEDPNL